MSKKRRKHRPSDEDKVVKCCFECDHCIYCCEGDHLCDVNNEFITEDWEPTDMFYHCLGKEFIER